MFSQSEKSKNAIAKTSIDQLLKKFDDISLDKMNPATYSDYVYDINCIISIHLDKLTDMHYKLSVIDQMETRLERLMSKYPKKSRAYVCHALLLEKKIVHLVDTAVDKNVTALAERYEEIIKTFPEYWLLRINYLNFASHYLSSETTIDIAKKYLVVASNAKTKPTSRQLAQIKLVLAIEYEKEGDLEKSKLYSKEAISHDPDYAPTYSTLAKYYDEQASRYYESGKFEQGEKFKLISRNYYDTALQLDKKRFDKNHSGVTPTSASVTIVSTAPAWSGNSPVIQASNTKNLKNAYWPSLSANPVSMSNIKKEFMTKFPLMQFSSAGLSDFDKAAKAMMIAEETNTVTPVLVNTFIAAAITANKKSLAVDIEKRYSSLLTTKSELSLQFP